MADEAVRDDQRQGSRSRSASATHSAMPPKRSANWQRGDHRIDHSAALNTVAAAAAGQLRCHRFARSQAGRITSPLRRSRMTLGLRRPPSAPLNTASSCCGKYCSTRSRERCGPPGRVGRGRHQRPGQRAEALDQRVVGDAQGHAVMPSGDPLRAKRPRCVPARCWAPARSLPGDPASAPAGRPAGSRTVPRCPRSGSGPSPRVAQQAPAGASPRLRPTGRSPHPRPLRSDRRSPASPDHPRHLLHTPIANHADLCLDESRQCTQGASRRAGGDRADSQQPATVSR